METYVISQLVNVTYVNPDLVDTSAQNANATFKAVKTTNVDLTVANVNVKMDIQEFIANCQ
jgi:PKD repeat protein